MSLRDKFLNLSVSDKQSEEINEHTPRIADAAALLLYSVLFLLITLLAGWTASLLGLYSDHVDYYIAWSFIGIIAGLIGMAAITGILSKVSSVDMSFKRVWLKFWRKCIVGYTVYFIVVQDDPDDEQGVSLEVDIRYNATKLNPPGLCFFSLNLGCFDSALGYVVSEMMHTSWGVRRGLRAYWFEQRVWNNQKAIALRDPYGKEFKFSVNRTLWFIYKHCNLTDSWSTVVNSLSRDAEARDLVEVVNEIIRRLDETKQLMKSEPGMLLRESAMNSILPFLYEGDSRRSLYTLELERIAEIKANKLKRQKKSATAELAA